MLFNENNVNNPHIFESKKERNLYYKFFAGYLCNDLIPGWEERLKRLVGKIQEDTKNNSFSLRPETTHVSFDNFSSQIFKRADRGEFADVFLMDWKEKYALAIEAKFTDDPNGKDVINNGEKNNYIRIKKLRDEKIFKNIVSVLLVTSSMKKGLENKLNSPRSNLKRLIAFNKTLDDVEKIHLWTWEELIEICDEGKAKNYFKNHISLNKKEDWEYKVNDGELIRGGK